MSTRAVIARAQNGSWIGRFHHWDGYPTGLGLAIQQNANGLFKGDLAGLMHLLIDEHPAGWDSIVDKDLSLPAGLQDMVPSHSLPCTICGEYGAAHLCQNIKDHPQPLPCGKNYAFHLGHEHQADPVEVEKLGRYPQCLCHGEGQGEAWAVTPENIGDSWCEWLYVVDVEAQTMAVRSSYDDWEKVLTVNLDRPSIAWAKKLERSFE